jgi:hypothetical protein
MVRIEILSGDPEEHQMIVLSDYNADKDKLIN